MDYTNVLLALIIGLETWNLRATYALNGRSSRVEATIESHDYRLGRLETA